MERGRRLKRASRRVALFCFAAFAVLAGLRQVRAPRRRRPHSIFATTVPGAMCTHSTA